MPSDYSNSAYSLAPRAFISSVARDVRAHYTSLGREPNTEVHSRLAKFWWGNDKSVHYELAVHERMLQLELGLHFEDYALRNQRLLAAFSPHLLEIQHVLGESIWLETWDRGWTRIYETLPLLPLIDDRCIPVAARLCAIIDCLQPILDVID